MSKKITASVLTLGCRVNQYESDYIMEELEKQGVEIVKHGRGCDIYVINTCTVTAESDRKSRQLIRKCIKASPNAIIIVTGCFSQINPDIASKIEGVHYVCGNNIKSQIPKIIFQLLEKKPEECVVNMGSIHNGCFDVMGVGAPITRTRAFIKIEDGCDSKCAYCIIPKARGGVRSNSCENVIKEVENIANQGCVEVVLTGIETASYGKYLKNGFGLADLIERVSQIDGIKRIRLGSLDPSAITKDFVDKVRGIKKLMPHFHISMQSGCTKTLNAMRRKYNIDMAKKNIAYLKECIPSVMLSADVITGFPGESRLDFDETLQFFNEEEFWHLHIFPYSQRQGTEASTMANQIPDGVKKGRLYALDNQQKEIKKRIAEKYVCGYVTDVLFETFDTEYAHGHTPEFFEIRVPSDKNYSGQILPVRITGFDGEGFIGEFIK
ncbi:MAG: tRNA (N(6)-L-threonylcarbamoyladenosine(37)-C(2))-methylthiotransferase MtaB [Clostridia bacterium]|nr:tRNA (N(6)-L-threonylcarbamoyladenosine(37)-C(2))-methylthiotransferase MtaB [Clostridia bacterium]